MKFEDIEPIQHPIYPSFDKQWKVEFENGNGLSIVNGNNAYCDEDTYEIAPLYNGHLLSEGVDAWGDQVKGYVTEDLINEILEHAENEEPEIFIKYLNTI